MHVISVCAWWWGVSAETKCHYTDKMSKTR
jgi:hypothetical protein